MTSQESIGSCSLDVDQSASDRSETTVDSVSKKTLHSLNLSCNGGSVSSSGKLANGSSETLQKSQLTPDENLNVSNGHRGSAEPEQLTVKKPSYLGLACSISGYSGLNRYDSKLREGFRSRDSSPGTRLIARDTSPAGFRSNESLNVPAHSYPPKSQSISPLAMDRQNGFSNGLKEDCKVEAYRESRSSISICQGYSEVDKGVMHSTFPDLSPIRASTPGKLNPGMMSCSQQNKSFASHFSGSSPKPANANLSNASFSDTSILNGSSTEVESPTLNISSSSEKSFIQQRVERLYGPGALAQGFFFKRSTSRLNASESSFNKSSNNNDVSADNANAEESLKNLPVLRHLRPEFRAQLPVVSPRRPTDGSEQILKPLQRVTPVSRKTEQKPKIQGPSSLEGKIAEGKVQKLNSSTASIPDQQPAAPKVVLPVLEPSASSTNVAKLALEAEKAAEEKDGHYFVKLLKQETGRLLTLAASAEAELVSDTVALPEEAAGKLRSAAGKARLLASQKMQQFAGLCQKNINQVPGEEFPTTNEDLAGFWDMVMLQVVQVNDLFDQIEKLRNSQWQEVCSVSLHPQTPPSPKRTQRKFPSRRSFHDMKPLQKPSRAPFIHFLNDKRARLHSETLNEPEKLVPSKTSSSCATEKFPLEMRLCDDAFRVLTNLQDLEDNETSCDGETCDLGCEDSNPFLSESVNEIEPLGNNVPLGNPCTRYVVNYVDVLQPSFRLEELGRRSYGLFPREDFFEHGVGRHLSREKSKLEVIFKKETDKAGGKNVTVDSFSNRSQKTGNNTSELPATGKSSKNCVNRTLSPIKNKWTVERKRENVRGKAKSYSPIGRTIKNEVTVRRRTRSRTPEGRLQKVNPIKPNAGDQYKFRTPRLVSARKMDEGKASRPRLSSKPPFKYVSPPRPVACNETKKRNPKKLGFSVTFLDNVKETTLSSKRILSGDCNAEKTQKFVNLFHGNSKRKTWMSNQSIDKESLPSSNQTKVQAPRIKENCHKNASKANAKDVGRGNLSVMSEVEAWSNHDSLNNKRKFHGRPEGPVKNCTANRTWTRKKQEQAKDPPKKMEQESTDSLEASDSICWRLSDSKPFIPLSQEALRQLRLVYNTHNQDNLSAFQNKSEKLDRMRFYDKKRKRISKNRDDEPPRKLISRGTTPNMSEDNLVNPVDIRVIRSLNFYDTNIASGITSFMNDGHDISVECLITPRVMKSHNKSTLVLNNIASNITMWPEKNVEIEELLSSLISSLSPEIASRVPKSSSTKLMNRVSVKKLSYDLTAESFETAEVNRSLVVDISQHAHSDFTVGLLRDRKSGKSGKSVNFDKYLPWKRELNVARCLEDLKHVQLYPENSKAHSYPFDSKRLPGRVKHACAFVRSNRTLCRLSLYLYVYGILSIVLLFLKIGSCSHCFLDPRVLYKSF